MISDSPVKLMHDGNFSRTPVMIGVTKNEAAFWLFAVPGNVRTTRQTDQFSLNAAVAD